MSRNAGFNAKQLDKSGLFRTSWTTRKAESYPYDQHFGAAFPPHLKTGRRASSTGCRSSILTVVRYVNKDLLKKAGLAAPNGWDKGNWTQQQTLEYATKNQPGRGQRARYGQGTC